MLGHKRTDVVSTWSVVFSLRKIRIPMSHKVRMAACISVCLAIKCYCVTSPCPWSLRHSTFRFGLLQNAIVWPIHVPDPLDTAHFGMACYKMLLCDQSMSLIPQIQHISLLCYRMLRVWPVRVPDPLHTAHSLTTREHSAIAVSAIFITENTASLGTQHFAIDTALHSVARQRRDD